MRFKALPIRNARDHGLPLALQEDFLNPCRPLLGRLSINGTPAENFTQSLAHLIMGFLLREALLQSFPNQLCSRLLLEVVEGDVFHCFQSLPIQKCEQPRTLLRTSWPCSGHPPFQLFPGSSSSPLKRLSERSSEADMACPFRASYLPRQGTTAATYPKVALEPGGSPAPLPMKKQVASPEASTRRLFHP